MIIRNQKFKSFPFTQTSWQIFFNEMTEALNYKFGGTICFEFAVQLLSKTKNDMERPKNSVY